MQLVSWLAKSLRFLEFSNWWMRRSNWPQSCGQAQTDTRRKRQRQGEREREARRERDRGKEREKRTGQFFDMQLEQRGHRGSLLPYFNLIRPLSRETGERSHRADSPSGAAGAGTAVPRLSVAPQGRSGPAATPRASAGPQGGGWCSCATETSPRRTHGKQGGVGIQPRHFNGHGDRENTQKSTKYLKKVLTRTFLND